MAAVAEVGDRSVPWWKEPTKDQWTAWTAGWLGWMLDAFDFTIFFLIMVPISQEFGVPLTLVAGTVTFTLWLRLLGAFGSGWLCDRIGRKTPLMISIFWYSICNFAAGFAPSFAFLAFFRIILGIGMGAEWPAGAALAMESWPARSRGIMSGLLQGAWGLGFLLASLVYGLLYQYIGWRGMLWVGILPALLCVYIRFFVKESPVWEENHRKRIAEQALTPAPASRFNSATILTVIGWLAGALVVAFVLFHALKLVLPPVLGGLVEPKLLGLLLDDKLMGVVAAGLTPFVLPNIVALLGLAIPTQLAIFRPPLLRNTFTASIWMTGQFLVYYSMIAMFASWLQKDLKLSPGDVALPNILHNAVVFFAMGFWGFVGDKIGRRLAIIIPAIIGCFIAPLYLHTTDLTWITIGFALQGAFAGAIYGLQPAYLTERFPTEVRGTASAFCYHFGTILGGLVPPAITFLAVDKGMGFPEPMLYGTIIGAVVAVVALILSPETKGVKFTSDVQVR
ncbi:MAG TPA: MFS transporter [Hyphomicrobiaceae bacterium]|nr:MFS transporter [Hyphomicrobiaceae bacterium]